LEKVATAALSLLLLPLILVKLTQQLPRTNCIESGHRSASCSLFTDNGIFIFDTRFPTSDELLQASFWFVNHIFVSLFNRLYMIRNKKESMIFTHA